ncbi:MAG: CTP-dependent riboflavin kinase [Candidatus ainarchaeum sp.]|nr:CTP-dependent riboflavin kinase [Candidatus ainarchaeum sp.]
MDEILIALARKGAHRSPVKLTTLELGTLLGMSQQNASRRLRELEKHGLISRSSHGLSLTPAGLESVREVYHGLKSAFESKSHKISGTICSGFGEGRYYLSFPEYKRQIAEKFGFMPYEGTLNLNLSEEQLAVKSAFVKNSEPVIIQGFKSKDRTFGDLFAYPCTVDGVKSALIIPARTHHPPGIIEIVAPFNLKKHLGKKDGDVAEISLG